MLNFVEADLQGVVRALAAFTGRNFVVDPRVRGPLTLVSETPVDASTAYSMLLAALRMQGYAVVEVDGILRVVPEADPDVSAAFIVTVGLPTAREEGFWQELVMSHPQEEWGEVYRRVREAGRR